MNSNLVSAVEARDASITWVWGDIGRIPQRALPERGIFLKYRLCHVKDIKKLQNPTPGMQVLRHSCLCAHDLSLMEESAYSIMEDLNVTPLAYHSNILPIGDGVTHNEQWLVRRLSLELSSLILFLVLSSCCPKGIFSQVCTT
jgi:hypothetical protein